MVDGFKFISIAHFRALYVPFLSKSCCSLDLAVSFYDIFTTYLLHSSLQSYIDRFQLLAQSRDIGNQNFVSPHFGFTIIDFDEGANMPY